MCPEKETGIQAMVEEPAETPRVARVEDVIASDMPLLSAADWSALREHYGLSPRQGQTAELVCRAYDHKRIAGELHVTSDTVRMHLKEVFRKVGVESRTGLLVRMMQVRKTLRKEEPRV